MPFRGVLDGKIVVPATVSNQERVICPDCGNTMYVREGENRARHFCHSIGGETCPGISAGESVAHARCVALAVAALQEMYGSQATRLGAEIEIDVSESGSGNYTRRADALVEFVDENRFFGNGLILEVQHEHHEKNIKTTTHDYLSAGYSVAWLSSDEFGEEQLNKSLVDEAFRVENNLGYSVTRYSPKQFLDCESYQHSGEHNWGTVPGYVLTCEEDYEICTSRRCTLRRQYDDTESKYVYGPESITTPDLPLRVLQSTVVEQHSGTLLESLRDRYHEAVLEKALADRPEIDACPGPKGFHEWKRPESPWNGTAKVELRACQYCSVHLLSDLRGYADERTDLLFNAEPEPEWDLLSLESDPRQCQNRSHEDDRRCEFCPDCGVSDP